jgi:hypothetical protein
MISSNKLDALNTKMDAKFDAVDGGQARSQV